MRQDNSTPEQEENLSQLPLQPIENPTEHSIDDEKNVKEPQEDFDFERMDKDVEEFRQKIQSINPEVENSSEEFSQFEEDYTPLRRRRRQVRPSEQDVDVLDNLGEILERANPNLDFFLLSVLSGLVIGIGYAIDSNAILMFGIFVTPFLGPLVGLIISSLIGDKTTYKQTGGALLTGLFLTLVSSSIIGGISRLMPTNNAIQAYYHSHLWWPDFLLIIIGTILLNMRFVQNENRPIIPALMVAYGLYLPIGVAGFGLGSGIKDLWPQGLFVFLVHLSISILISYVIFVFMGVRPKNKVSIGITSASILVCVLVLAYFGGIGNFLNGDKTDYSSQEQTISPTPLPTNPPLTEKAVPTLTSTKVYSPTSIPPTIAPIETSVGTPQPLSTIAIETNNGQTYGRILSTSSDGVVVRNSPSGTTITTVMNDYLVQIMDDKPVINEQGTWIHVLIKLQTSDIDGWVLSAYIVTETPSNTP